jgi:hypothetical protein
MSKDKSRLQAPYYLDELIDTAARLRAAPHDLRLRDDMDRGIRETDLEIQFAAWLAMGDDEDLEWALRRVGWTGLDAPPIAELPVTMDERAQIYVGLRLEEIASSRDGQGVVDLLATRGYKTTVNAVPDLLAGARYLDQPLGRAWARVIGEVHFRVDASFREWPDDPVAHGLSRFLKQQFKWIREAQDPGAFRRARADAGLKSSQLAAKMGVSYQLVYGFESGQFQIPFRHRRRLDQIALSDRRQSA